MFLFNYYYQNPGLCTINTYSSNVDQYSLLPWGQKGASLVDKTKSTPLQCCLTTISIYDKGTLLWSIHCSDCRQMKTLEYTNT